MLSRACGAVLAAAGGRLKGPQRREPRLCQGLQGYGERDERVRAARFSGSSWAVAWWRGRGIAIVMRWPQRRQGDVQAGRRVGREDPGGSWSKPTRPAWMDEAPSAALPATGDRRRRRVGVPQQGCRTRVVGVATTFLEAQGYPKEDRAGLSRARWPAGLESARSSRPGRSTCCGARHQRGCARQSVATCWSTTCSVRPWPTPPWGTGWCHARGACKGRARHWRPLHSLGAQRPPDRTREDRPSYFLCDRQSPRGNPTGPLRAASVQATSEAVSPPEGPATARPRTLGNSRLRPRKRHSRLTPTGMVETLHGKQLPIHGVVGLIQQRAAGRHLWVGEHRIPPRFLGLKPAPHALAMLLAHCRGDVSGTVA